MVPTAQQPTQSSITQQGKKRSTFSKLKLGSSMENLLVSRTFHHTHTYRNTVNELSFLGFNYISIAGISCIIITIYDIPQEHSMFKVRGQTKIGGMTMAATSQPPGEEEDMPPLLRNMEAKT